MFLTEIGTKLSIQTEQTLIYISINHPSVTVFINCVYGCKNKVSILPSLHVPFKKLRLRAYSAMLRNLNFFYIAKNHSSVKI